jgi:hypothetical protein
MDDMTRPLPLILALALLAGLAHPAPAAPPRADLDELCAALLVEDVRRSWDAARTLLERRKMEARKTRLALGRLVEEAGLEVEVPKRLGRHDLGPLLDRVRQAGLELRLRERGVTVPEGMTVVPGGVAIRPVTEEEVVVPPFLLDRVEVSRDVYRRFLTETGHRGEGEGFLEGWSDERPPKGTGKLPVVHVSRADADAHARWRGARLPTVEEWIVARGGCARLRFPWGAKPETGKANVIEKGTPGRPEPVDGRPEGATSTGVLRLAGNVAEWTASTWGPAGDRGIVAGESFLTLTEFSTTLLRRTLPGTRRRDLGFRCARDLPASR